MYCVAAIAAILMKDFGPQALFVHNCAVHIAIAAFALWRLIAQPGKRRRRLDV